MFAGYLRYMYDPSNYGYGSGGLPSLPLEDYVSVVGDHLNSVFPDRQTSVKSKTADRKTDAKKFRFRLNVKHFRPEEIEVKTVENCIVIHCKHEEYADDHGLVSREFTRRSQLPDDIELETVKSFLSQCGVLTITARRKAIEPPPTNERIVPIAIQQPGF